MTRSLTLFTSLLALASPAFAEDLLGGQWSANLGVVSDYSFRGISQSDDSAALQGGFDWTHNAGAYLGIWGSTVDLADADVEFDLYGGWGGTLDNGMSWKLGAIYYAYPGASSSRNYDYVEGTGSLGYDFGFLSTTIGMNISPDFFAGSGFATYSYADATVPIKLGQEFDLGLTAHAGNQTVQDNNDFGSPDYVDYSLGVKAGYAGYTAHLQYIGTDLDEPQDCTGCDDRVVFGLSRSF
jgi:uncharacterized protein (TIGR02001 family)